MPRKRAKQETCIHCAHQWVPYTDDPKSCPACRRKHAGQVRRRPRLTCVRCEYSWIQRHDLPPVRCSKCGNYWDRPARRQAKARR